METLIVRPENKEQLTAIKAVMKALKISFEIESDYDPEFVKMIQQGDEDIRAGKGVKVNINELISKGLQDVEEGCVLKLSDAKQKFLKRQHKKQ